MGDPRYRTNRTPSLKKKPAKQPNKFIDVILALENFFFGLNIGNMPRNARKTSTIKKGTYA